MNDDGPDPKLVDAIVVALWGSIMFAAGSLFEWLSPWDAFHPASLGLWWALTCMAFLLLRVRGEGRPWWPVPPDPR